ncbi:dethiobiotin synthase [Halostagnicola kamekurae]|uniref:ATP-dependent dethiobiotin synthetase BioD n=1 Tax=Halostagnicola kamekurae TaxID=619731 RepID=A0A1I6QDE7_9EURY|nr:dethiobiotin synthase [Halostagnicola kamekurae]SFS50464.1 dethiobiotin synthetase [Halostagnicola kamekurae]
MILERDDDRLAVVGTDTGVGKTVVTAAVVRALRTDGIDARAVKPAQTGHPPDDDAGFVEAACEDTAAAAGGGPDAATCFEYLEEPLAPRVAAERAGVDLSYDELRDRCEDALEAAEIGVLEGIGGLYVPLAGDRNVIDLVADLACPAVVVARSGLGTLNHTALTVETLERRGVDVRSIVCNGYRGETAAERTNVAELERMTGHTVETVPQLSAETPRELALGVGRALSIPIESGSATDGD